MIEGWSTLAPLLGHIHTHLDGDLRLATLARRAGLTPFQLHRLFVAGLHETPKAAVTRLRLARCAFRMAIEDASLLTIALDAGFKNPETFTRAFQRHYGRTPTAYRRWLAAQRGTWRNERLSDPVRATPGFALSTSKLVSLKAMHLACVRHVGPYEAVPQAIFDELEAWANARRQPGPFIWMGIGHDAPGAVPHEQLRFDAAIVVPGPFQAQGRVQHRFLPGGDVSLTTHAGSFDTLPQAYEALLPQVLAMRGVQLVGLPAMEFYHGTPVNTALAINRTDIALPVRRLAAGG
ncbi:MAG: AraC family transcriptional regulator [Rubrivivax sp.]|nr:AraC family transcriptional regulator [Rubrivivax sp.]